MAAVAMRGLCARYPSSAGRCDGEASGAEPLFEISATVREGELCAVLGANGAGKSTLLRAIAGALPTSSGELELFGRPAEAMSRAERARAVALVPQRSEVALGFSVREVVAMGRAPHQGAMMRMRTGDHEAVASALAACEGFEGLAHRPVAELSGGEQKRVHIARALAQQAPLLLLDEAAAHLDIMHATRLYRLIGDEVRARGVTCIMAMHDLDAAAHHADRVWILKSGRLLAAGPPAEVMTPELLAEAFGVRVEVGQLPSGRPYFSAC